MPGYMLDYMHSQLVCLYCKSLFVHKQADVYLNKLSVQLSVTALISSFSSSEDAQIDLKFS